MQYPSTFYMTNQEHLHEQELLKRRKSNMINHLLDTIEYQSYDKNHMKNSLHLADKQFQTMYVSSTHGSLKSKISIRQQIQRQLYNQTINNKYRLKLPKPNTLTDQFLKMTLGCQEDLINSYNQATNQKKNINNSQQDRNNIARQYFLSQKNSFQRLEQQKQGKNQKHANFFANTGNNNPLYDEEYLRYLKTNALLMSTQKQKLKNNSIQDDGISSWTAQQKSKAFSIIEKLRQTGGIQDTIKIMQKSLNKNQIKHLKKNQYIKSNNFQEPNPENKKKINHHKRRSHQISNQNSLEFKNKCKRTQSTNFMDPKESVMIKQQVSNIRQNNSVNINVSISNNWKQRSKSLREKLSKNLQSK